MGKHVAVLTQMACLWGIGVPKPGNVTYERDFSNLQYEDYLLSAIAIGNTFEKSSNYGVGQTILQAIQATRRFVNINTNLGTVLLLAPLVKAGTISPGSQLVISPHFNRIEKLREDLSFVLANLTVADAQDTVTAIRLSDGGGSAWDDWTIIPEQPSISLLKAMALLQNRDSIASEYLSRFRITFEVGYPVLESTYCTLGKLAPAILQAYLSILAKVPDTSIARKEGMKKADEVASWATDVLNAGGVFTENGQSAIQELDTALRSSPLALYPLTTADLTIASIFLHLYSHSNRVNWGGKPGKVFVTSHESWNEPPIRRISGESRVSNHPQASVE